MSSLSAPVRGKAVVDGVLTDQHIQRGDFPDGKYRYQFHDGSYYLGEWKKGVI